MGNGRSPLSLIVARSLWRRGYRRLPGLVLGAAKRLGRLERTVLHPLGPEATVEVPLWRNAWDRADIRSYESEMIDLLAARIDAFGLPVTLVDVGADIGLVSARLATSTPLIRHVVALEPNPESFVWLEKNLAQLGASRALFAMPVKAAAGRIRTRGILRAPDYDPTHHAWYVEPRADGDLEVIRIDDLELSGRGCLVIKIDVEGTEADVVEGARQTIARFDEVIVAFEAQRHSAHRAGIDPAQIVARLENLGLREATIAEHPQLQLDARRPFFEQVPPRNVFNVVASKGLRSPQALA